MGDSSTPWSIYLYAYACENIRAESSLYSAYVLMERGLYMRRALESALQAIGCVYITYLPVIGRLRADNASANPEPLLQFTATRRGAWRGGSGWVDALYL